jgi:hypothetical protein
MGRGLVCLSVGDYSVVTFCTERMVKMYSAPITGKEPSTEANFARRIGSSFMCHWLNVEYISIINAEEVCQFLPHSVLNKHRRFKFNVCFILYNVC